jgi:hypothetical protein
MAVLGRVTAPARLRAGVTPILLAGLGLTSVGCDPSNTDRADKGAEASGDKSAETMGTFTCKDIKDDKCVGATGEFDAAVPIVHVTYKTKDLPKQGDVYVIQWIAEDVGDAAPANTVISTLEEKVVDDPSIAKNYVVNSSLTKPTAGWPVGKYRVEIKLEDELLTTARFSIG